MTQNSAAHFDFALGIDMSVSSPAPAPVPASTTAEAFAELLYQNQLLTCQIARLRGTLARERKRLKNERKRGDAFFAQNIRLGAQIRCLLGEWEELLDTNYALESEILDVEEVMERHRRAERDRRRRAVGHGGDLGRCCPYSGRRARQWGATTVEEDGDWDDDCFSCCPCCRLSNCETACGACCRIEEHGGSGSEDGDGGGGGGTTTPPSSMSIGREGNIDDVGVGVGGGPGVDPVNDGDQHAEDNSGHGFGLEGDLSDAGVDEHAGDPDDSPNWTGDVPLWLVVNESNDGDKIKMDEIHLETEDDDGYIIVGLR